MPYNFEHLPPTRIFELLLGRPLSNNRDTQSKKNKISYFFSPSLWDDIATLLVMLYFSYKFATTAPNIKSYENI